MQSFYIHFKYTNPPKNYKIKRKILKYREVVDNQTNRPTLKCGK